MIEALTILSYFLLMYIRKVILIEVCGHRKERLISVCVNVRMPDRLHV